MDQNRCPVCGCTDLPRPAWRGESASHEICKCCGIQFGLHDATSGGLARRREIHAERRAAWVAAGCQWKWPPGPPEGWDPRAQLAALAEDPPDG